MLLKTLIARVEKIIRDPRYEKLGRFCNDFYELKETNRIPIKITLTMAFFSKNLGIDLIDHYEKPEKYVEDLLKILRTRESMGNSGTSEGLNKLLIDNLRNPDFVHKLLSFIAESRMRWEREKATLLLQKIVGYRHINYMIEITSGVYVRLYTKVCTCFSASSTYTRA